LKVLRIQQTPVNASLFCRVGFSWLVGHMITNQIKSYPFSLSTMCVWVCWTMSLFLWLL